MTRAFLAVLLAGCTAQAAPPVAGGAGAGGGPAAAGVTITVDQTYAQCIAAVGDAVAGDVCYPTDSAYWLLCRADGAWVHRIEGIAFDLTPPPSAGWSAYNGGVVTTVGGVRRLTIAVSGSTEWFGEFRDHAYTPGTDNFYVEWIIRENTHAYENYNSTAIMAAGLYEAADADILLVTGARDQSSIATYTAPGTIGTEYMRGNPSSADEPWLRVRWEVAANRTAKLMTWDGTAVSWVTAVGAHSDLLTPDGAWWGGKGLPLNTFAKVYDLVHYEEGAL